MSSKPLTAREACQVLRDIALGVRTMRRIGEHSWAEVYCGLVTVEVDGWVLRFYNDGNALGYCDTCKDPDGRAYVFDSFQRYGTDPVALLSTWELAQLQGMLAEL